MLLTNVPITEMQTTENWLIGLTGKRGTIVNFSSVNSGIQIQLLLKVRWEDGRITDYNFPDEVVNLKVDEEMIPTKLDGYMSHRRGQLQEQIDYFDKFTFVLNEEEY